jgi:hypothetical protein
VRLYLICPQATSRLQYVASILFENLLGLDLTIVAPEAFMPEIHVPALSYACSIDNLEEIPSAALLFETGLPRVFPETYENPRLPGLFPFPNAPGTFKFDILASAFWILIDGWELTGLLPKDLYDRTDGRHHPLMIEGWISRPIIHDYASALASRISGCLFQPKSGKIHITLDIDEPWMHAYKPWHIQLGGMIKSLGQGDMRTVKQRIKSLMGIEDPFYIFPHLTHPQSLILFFLIDRHDPKDGRHTWRLSAYRKLIQMCHERGIHIGIHPSFSSSDVPGRIAFEKQKLEEIIGQPVVSSRQHFLRYKNPETFRELEACGIRHEYSLCPIYACGYMRGMAQPFLWYDIGQERTSQLTLHPVMVMDRALQKYQGIRADEAWEKIKSEADTCLSYGGEFVILWHNATLSETGEWQGWKKVWTALQLYFEEKGYPS